jgi:hypothetical protein
VRERESTIAERSQAALQNCWVLRDHQGEEISNLINDKLQKQEMMTLDATCVSHLDEDNG